MKQIRNIYFNDIKNVAGNFAAAIIVIALMLLPSLYAWFNIEASWDPYGNTDQIPVAVVNEDKRVKVLDKEINVGDELIKTLQKNKSFEWHFVDRKDAMKKVKYGNYYAAIIIPEDFSAKLASIVSDTPTKTTIEYYVNEKVNAIAPKITEKGASVLAEQITSHFISNVNGVIFDIFNALGIEIQKDLPDIELFQNYLFLLEDKLPDIKTALDGTTADVKNAQKIVGNVKRIIPKAKDATSTGLKTIDDTTAFLNKTEARFNELSPMVKDDMAKVQKAAHDVDHFIGSLQPISIDQNRVEEIRSRTNEALKQMDNLRILLVKMRELNSSIDYKKLNEGMEELETIIQNQSPGQNDNLDQLKNELQQLRELHNSQHQKRDENLSKAIENLDSLKEKILVIQGNADKLKDFVTNMPKQEDVQKLTNDISRQVDAFVEDYNNEIEPTIRTQLKNAKDTLKEAREILLELQNTIPEVETILSHAEDKLAKGKEVLNYANGQYPYVSKKIRELAAKVRNLNKDANINDLIQLLRNDPDAERRFFAEPVKLSTHKIFPIANYGTGMTPFYTVLSLWVGGLLLISLMATEVHGIDNLSGKQQYFGKALTFLTIGFLQAIIVTTGDILFLGVDVKEPLWFVLFSLLISLVFVLIIYSLVSVFGNVGKALAIVFLVLQISSSGGTFPVVLLPEFFQHINPYLPFTYAVSLIREAVGGIILEKVIRDISILLIFGLLAIILGVFLKEPINKYSDKFKEKANKSGLFH